MSIPDQSKLMDVPRIFREERRGKEMKKNGTIGDRLGEGVEDQRSDVNSGRFGTAIGGIVRGANGI